MTGGTAPLTDGPLGQSAQDRPKLVVGISGATGFVYGARILELAARAEMETHLVVTASGQLTREYETDLSAREVAALASMAYRPADVGAPIASGSFRTRGMIVAPCSIRSLSAIACGLSDNLLTRAADVTLKERRPLVLMVRETPLHLGHLRAMTALTEMGAVVMPPVPAFYLRPETVEDIVTHAAHRALDLVGADLSDAPRWHGPDGRASADGHGSVSS
jgi:4-hydroxy-3-polyprenylbenzoate decarboxylase